MINLFMISILLLILYLTMNKTNIEHMTSDLSDSLVDKISLLNESNISLSAQVNNLKGIIVAWNGITPPTGWALCDGKNETPDLSGRFIFGYSPNNDLADNGANDAFNPTGGKYQRYSYAIGKVGGETIHTLSIGEMPNHVHKFINLGGYGALPGTQNASTRTFGYPYKYDTDTTSIGGGTYHNNMPPYYVLAYIMKL